MAASAQIIFDKIIQGKVGGGATLTMDVPIPSPDAVLVVTGGSVIATGGSWQSVKFNGNSLTKLIQAGVSGNSAEIWFMPNPPVGVYQLVIVPTASFGQVYANALVLLGVDKKSTNIITASATDAAATATITATITPDAVNSVLIDSLVAIDATAQPIADASQTQMFNPASINASEFAISTYKTSSNVQNNMNYNLSASVNASLVVAAFRPAVHPSIWYPNEDMREIDDVIRTNGLDAGTTLAGIYGYKSASLYLNSFFQTVGREIKVAPIPQKTNAYGYKPTSFYQYSFLHTIGRNVQIKIVPQITNAYGYKQSAFYLNSYLHTIGRNIKPANPAVVATARGSTLLLMGIG